MIRVLFITFFIKIFNTDKNILCERNTLFSKTSNTEQITQCAMMSDLVK